jgi:uncharacterized protein (TIGR02246 family)
MKNAIVAMLGAAALLAGCERGETQPEADAVNTNAIAEQIRAEEAQWVQDWASRDANRVMAHYSDDATVMAAGRLSGAAQIRSVVAAMVQDPNLDMRFTPDRVEVSASGDMAYARGTYSLRTTDPRTRRPRIEAGNYLTIFRRQADGSWKATEDIIAAGPAGASGG